MYHSISQRLPYTLYCQLNRTDISVLDLITSMIHRYKGKRSLAHTYVHPTQEWIGRNTRACRQHVNESIRKLCSLRLLHKINRRGDYNRQLPCKYFYGTELLSAIRHCKALASAAFRRVVPGRQLPRIRSTNTKNFIGNWRKSAPADPHDSIYPLLDRLTTKLGFAEPTPLGTPRG